MRLNNDGAEEAAAASEANDVQEMPEDNENEEESAASAVLTLSSSGTPTLEEDIQTESIHGYMYIYSVKSKIEQKCQIYEIF